MYVDYNFYKNTYKGKVSSIDFPRLEIQANSIVDLYTFNRIKEPDQKVKFAVCELVDYLKTIEDIGGKEIAQESVGGHSVTYKVVKTAEQKQYEIVKKYLAHTGLLYRGVR